MAQDVREGDQGSAAHGDKKSVIQLLMTACSIIGVEGTSAFGQIYAFMTLEYLGVPTSMASLNGVVGGCSSTFLIPCFGLLTDKGDNPKKRKMVTLLFGTLTLIGSLSSLLLAAVITIKEESDSAMPDLNNSISDKNERSPAPRTLSLESKESPPFYNFTDPYKTNTVVSKSQTISVSGVFGLVGFSLLDLGFDLGNSVSRAFALEHTPLSQQNLVLKIVSFLAPIAGGSVSMLGIFDFPSLLSNIFTIDGTAAMLLLFAIFLMGVVILSTMCSVLFSTRCGSPRLDERLSSSRKREAQSHSHEGKVTSNNWQNEKSFGPLLATSPTTSDRENVADEEMQTKDFIESTSERQPLLGNQENSGWQRKQRKYFGIKEPSADDNDVRVTSLHNVENETGNVKQTSSANYSTFEGSSPNNVAKVKLEITTETSVRSKNSKKPQFFSLPLKILILSTFASMLCMVSFTNYNSLSLTVGIYHGDSLAPLGSEAKRLYNDGLRKSALGNTIFYCSYLFTSILNKSLLDAVGKKVFFFMSQLLHASVTMSYILVQRHELYYIAMTTMGFFRWAVFTIPYMMANEFTNQSMSVNEKDRQYGTSKAGRVVAVITILCPINYLIVSAIMGPLISQTGNVWVPLICSYSSGFASVLLFLPLFFLK